MTSPRSSSVHSLVKPTSPSGNYFEDSARHVLDIEIEALKRLRDRTGADFSRACEVCLGCSGRIVVTGMGKSGHIGHKIAATLASTGSPAFFVHPGEAGHGDMGMMKPNDVILAISNSGETSEILTLLPAIKRLRVPLVTITGGTDSSMALAATVNLDASVTEEACPLNLAPTASTTVTLALGDALAVALLTARKFTADDFARSHPSGALGKRLLWTVNDLMHAGDELPQVPPTATLAQALMTMTEKHLGVTAIVDEAQVAVGIYTDGDLRRTLDTKTDVLNDPISQHMTTSFKSTRTETLAFDALRVLEEHLITSLLVTDDQGKLRGIVHLHDLFRAGVI